MDVEISVEEEALGTKNSIKEVVQENEGGASKGILEDEMDSLNEEEIWRSRRERINKALAAERQDPAQVYAAAKKLAEIIIRADVEEFISTIETLANQTDPSAIFNCVGASGRTLLHVAAKAGKDDILRLLFDYVPDNLIAAKDDGGKTPLHLAIGNKRSRAAAMLIRRAKDVPNVEDNNQIVRLKDKHGNTPLHVAVLVSNVDGVRSLLNEDLEPVYWKNANQMSPLYLACQSTEPKIHDHLFSLPLEPSRIQGLPPIHGAVLRRCYEFAELLDKMNMKLFEMTDSRGGNVFHFAAHVNRAEVFELLGPKTEYLAKQQDMNGDLPIHIASKMGHVKLIEKLHPVSGLLNRQGQTVLHVAAKYGEISVVKYILRHSELGELINEPDHVGNTPLHLAAMHSQPAILILLVLDQRIEPSLLNHDCLTANNIAEDIFRRFNIRGDWTMREPLGALVLRPMTDRTTDLLVLRPETRDKEFVKVQSRKEVPKFDQMKDVINTRILVAALVATVTFTAGFAVPGGFNSSDTAFKYDRGMATMLDKGMFQAFVICNSIAMFSSMFMVINLMYAQETDIYWAINTFNKSLVPLTIALPAMSAAFLTGVTLTIGKLPWLANIIFYLGLVFLLIILGITLLQYPAYFWSNRRSIHRLQCWLCYGYIRLRGAPTYILDDSEEDRTASGTSASQPPDGAGESKTDDSVRAKCGGSPHPPNH